MYRTISVFCRTQFFFLILPIFKEKYSLSLCLIKMNSPKKPFQFVFMALGTIANLFRLNSECFFILFH